MPNYYPLYDLDAPWWYRQGDIKKVVIEDGVTRIGNYAFWSCSGITIVTIPNSVTRIGDHAFEDCSSLTSITIPNSVTNIGDHAFYECSSLMSITIPNSVTSIGNYAFYGCSGLTSIIVDKNNSIYDSRNNCNAIIVTESNSLMVGSNNTVIPNTVTSIGESAFYGCSGLTSINIPNSVTWIRDGAFAGCSGLTAITVEKNNPIYDSRNNCNAIIATESNNLIVGCKNTVIPNSVTWIGDWAFSDCSGLNSINIPNSVTWIGDMAFSGCSGLNSINIPNSVTNIGDWAFAGCSSLNSVTIGNSVTSIGIYCFNACSISSVTCEAIVPPECDHSILHLDEAVLYVPLNSIEAYKKAYEWSTFTNIQAISNIYTLTDGTPYTNNTKLTNRDISYTRTFNNTSWQALYIPFSLNYDDWKDDFEVAYINGVRQLDKDDNGTIDETIMDVIKIKSGSTSPNMPYLIKAKTTGEKTFSVSNATIYPAEENSIDCSTTIAKYTFTGTYNSISSATIIANKYYAMGGGQLITSDGSNDLKPYRWYMKVESRNPSYNASNAAKTITINVIDDEEDEMTTGIRQLQMTNDELPVYDLNGRQVNENNLKPGIYVKNGKKFVVK